MFVCFVTEREDYYEFMESMFTFPSNSTNSTAICTNIAIIDDAILEPLQSFSILLTSNDSNLMVQNGRLLISIVDNDGEINLIVL